MTLSSKQTPPTPCQFTRVLTDTLREQRRTNAQFVLSVLFSRHTIHQQQPWQQWRGLFWDGTNSERKTEAYGSVCQMGIRTRREHAVLLSCLESMLGYSHCETKASKKGRYWVIFLNFFREINVCRGKLCSPWSGPWWSQVLALISKTLRGPVQTIWRKMGNSSPTAWIKGVHSFPNWKIIS